MSHAKRPSDPVRPDIAVVGLSALFPGSLDGAGFWKDILAGTDLITDVPTSHWLIEDYYDPDPSVPDKTYARRGAFLRDIDFDAMGWGIPPSIIPETDTSQLLALIVAQRVLQDAAIGPLERMDHSRTSVILGVTSGQELLGSMVSRLQRPVWTKCLREAGLPESEVGDICERIASHYTPWRESTFPGLLGNVVAGRIANRLNLGGTNCVTDAACASALSSLSMAVNELYLGDSDMVIAGGVDTMNDIFMFMCFSKTPALSPSGDCRPFSDKADGTMLGEGIGMLALKRLADAERDGNRIYAVIKAVGSSSDGRSKSVYAPLPEGQARSLRRAYELAGYGPETVEFVEAHGTGTVAGDAAEFESLSTVFNESGRKDRQWCTLGSVKAQIGHTKSAAGAAGLFKAVMALHHKILPPIIKIDRPNPALALNDSPFHLTSRARPWVRNSSHPRRASVSSFGFGGSNFHVALEEYVPSRNSLGSLTLENSRPAATVRTARLRTFGHELVVLQGNSGAEIAQLARKQAEACSKPGFLAWLAHHTQTNYRTESRPESVARLAVVATDEADLRSKLEQAAARLTAAPATAFSTPTGIYFGSGAGEGGLAFLFPGQGSQYADMGSAVAMHFDEALAVWDNAANLSWDDETDIHEVVFARTAYEEETRAQQSRLLTATEWAQPAIGCMSLSLLALLGKLGLQADCYGGHSFGEVTALCAGGVVSPADFVRVARRRGELMAQAARRPGSMIAVAQSLADIQAKLKTWEIDVVVANHNGPAQVVLSGNTADIAAVEAKLSQAGITAHRLSVATAFHSPIVAEATEAFDKWLGEISFQSPTRPVYSNTSARPHPDDPALIRTRLAEQLAHPVLFMDMVESIYKSGVRTFVEVGPGSVLTELVGRILEGRPHAAINLDRRGVDGIRSLLQGLGALVAAGHSLDFAALWSEYSVPENPHDRAQPKLAVALNGSNYGKPYPPKGGASELPKPNGPRAAAPPTRRSASSPTDEATRGAAPATVAPTATAAPGIGSSASSRSSSEGWAAAFESAQQQTAAAHSAYIQAMASSHQAFLDTIEHGFDALAAGLGQRAVVGGTNGYVANGHAPATGLQQIPLPSPAAPNPIALPGHSRSIAPRIAAGLATTAPAVAPPQAAPALDLQALMLEIVSDKTGYPTEMLTMGMELEGDLGIDSIKRVEILAAMQERAPGLPEVEVRVMAKLRTLGQIVEYMDSQLGKTGGTVTAASQRVAHAMPTVVPPAQTAASNTQDLQVLMLEIVSDKTGYPTEMLTLDMELEGDLGIDSIKRVEILAAMQERAPGLPEVEIRVMAKLRTLGQIVEYMNGKIGSAGGTAPNPSASSPIPQTPSLASDHAGAAVAARPQLGRFALQAVERSPISMSEHGILGKGRVVVTDEGRGLAQCVVDELGRYGISAEAVAEVPQGDLRGVIFLGGLREVESDEAAIAVNREAFAAARAAAASFAGRDKSEGFFLTVQDTGGAFATDGVDPRRAWLAGCAGLARTLAQEWPGVAVKAIDLERGNRPPQALAVAIAEELLSGGPDLDVGLAADLRRIVLRNVATLGTGHALRLCDGDVIVASGGARGVTAATLIALAQGPRLRFVLLGRTRYELETPEPSECAGIENGTALKRALLALAKARGESLTPGELGRAVGDLLARREIRATLTAFEDAGCEGRYIAVDVADSEAVALALRDVRKTWGPISAVVHGAGVIHDRLVAEKTPEQFDSVFDTKVKGLRALLHATEQDPLKVLCVFSSVAARCGNLGQSDYAMANEVLNKVAVSEAMRRGGSCLVRSLGWGPWAGGMVSPQLQSRFEALGVPLIDLETGAQMFVDELTSAPTEGIAQVELVLGAEPRSEALVPSAVARTLSLDVIVSRHSHPYLSDHSIRATPVVPVVMGIEWFGRAVRAFAPELSVAGFRNLKVLRGIPLRNFAQGELHLVVDCRQVKPGDDSTLALELRDPSGIPFYRCTAELVGVRSRHEGKASGTVPDLDLQAWGDRQVYDGDVLFHGPKFQMIRNIDGVSDLGIAARLDGVADLGWHLPTKTNGTGGHRSRLVETDRWCTDPAVFDGGLQLAVLWCKHRLGVASLPTSIAAVRTWSDEPPAGPIHCTLTGREARGQRSISDLVFRDGSGRVFAEFEGVETHLIPDAGAGSGRADS